MPICAYCASERPATKEHIWPSTLIRKFETLYTFNGRTNKVYVGDAVVKDVCAACNNERLSALDVYLSTQFDAWFAKVVAPGESVRFEYNYAMLSRALLKILYNSARASKDIRSQSAHKQFAPFILGGGHSNRLALRLQIVTRSKTINLETGNEGTLDPVSLRCATLAYDGPLSHRFLVRIIGFNSYWFFLVLSYKPEPHHKWKKVLEGLSHWKVPTGLALSSSGTRLDVPVELTTYMHPQLLGSLLEAERL